MCMVSLDSVWAGCPYALWYVAALTITLYQSDPACHYLIVCNVVHGLPMQTMLMIAACHNLAFRNSTF